MYMTYELQQHDRYIPARYVTNDQTSGHAVPERRKIGVGTVVVVVVIVMAAVIGFGSDVAASGRISAVSESSEITDTIEIYVVQPGDTLWEIASAIALPGEDVRPLVDALQEIAGGSQIDVGQQLIIDHAMIRR